MSGYNFTDRVRRLLAIAREEALRLRHEYIGTEHILLGLLKEGDGLANQVLANLSIEAQDLLDAIHSAVMKGTGSTSAGSELPYTSRAKKVLEHAMGEARELGHGYVGSEHLLLGLIREEKSIAAQVLAAAGAKLEAVRAETTRLAGEGRSDGEIVSRREAASNGRARTPDTAEVRSLIIELRRADGSAERRELASIGEAIRYLGGLLP